MPPIDPSPHGKEILHQPPRKFPEPTPAPLGPRGQDEPAATPHREGKLDPADPRSLDESGADRDPGERVPRRP